MWIWAVMIVSGVCAVWSFYTAFLAFRLGDGGVFLFSFFGLFFGIFFVTSAVKLGAGKSALMKQAADALSGEPRPVSFVPHRFMMLALIIAGIGILAAILIPLLFR